MAEDYRYQTVYQFSSNQPIHAPELEGLENAYDLNTRALGAEDGRKVNEIQANGVKEIVKHGTGYYQAIADGNAQLDAYAKDGIDGARYTSIAQAHRDEGTDLGNYGGAGSKPRKAGRAKLTSSQLEGRAKELHSKLHPMKQRMTTTAVGQGTNGNGKNVVVVGHSDKYLPKQIRENLKKGEIGISKVQGHAEGTVIDGGNQQGVKVKKVAASRPICDNCSNHLNNNNVQPASRLKNPPNQE